MKIKKYFKKTLLIVFCSLLILPLLWNLLRPGFYTSDDGEWMVIRLTAFHNALRQGQFPSRWLPRLNHGYGYPVANFLYPLPFYLAEPIYFLTGNPAAAIQFVMAISVISMAVGMFTWLHARNNQQSTANSQQNSKIWSAIVGTLVYVYSPYVAFNLYQRGSLGEIVAMGIVPWIFWAISRRKLPLAAILTAGLILSHNVVAILFLPLIVLYLMWSRHCEERSDEAIPTRLPRFARLTGSLAMTIATALSLSAFFWLPALAELRFVRAGQISVSDFQNEYLSLSQTLNRAGIITVFFSGGLPLFFLTKSSIWLWETLKFAQIIQFPWRLLSVFSFVAAVVTFKFITFLRHCEESRFNRDDVAIPTRLPRFGTSNVPSLAMTVIVITSFLSSMKYLTPASFINRPPEYYQTNDDTTTVRAEYTPIWVTNLPQKLPETPQVHYYPGWKIFIDGKKTPVADPNSTNGVLLPATSYNTDNIKYRFTETPLRTFANLLSIAAALVWLHWFSITLDNRSQP